MERVLLRSKWKVRSVRVLLEIEITLVKDEAEIFW